MLNATGDQFKHGAQVRRFKNDLGNQAALGLKIFFVAQGPPGFDLSAQGSDELGILPRLQDEIPHATSHSLNGQLDAAPRRHDNDRQRVVERPHGVQQV